MKLFLMLAAVGATTLMLAGCMDTSDAPPVATQDITRQQVNVPAGDQEMVTKVFTGYNPGDGSSACLHITHPAGVEPAPGVQIYYRESGGAASGPADRLAKLKTLNRSNAIDTDGVDVTFGPGWMPSAYLPGSGKARFSEGCPS